jgi:hypothetical protein
MLPRVSPGGWAVNALTKCAGLGVDFVRMFSDHAGESSED